MTKTLTFRGLDIPQIHKFGIGFDSVLDELLRVTSHQTTNYPPHNVIKTGDDTVTIEVAVAGFSEGEITVSVENRMLAVCGARERVENIGQEYLHRGISSRDFRQEFTLAEYVEVVGASVKNGILIVHLERKVPDEKKPRSIAITYDK